MLLEIIVDTAVRGTIFTIDKTISFASWMIWGTPEDRLEKLVKLQQSQINQLSDQVFELKKIVSCEIALSYPNLLNNEDVLMTIPGESSKHILLESNMTSDPPQIQKIELLTCDPGESKNENTIILSELEEVE